MPLDSVLCDILKLGPLEMYQRTRWHAHALSVSLRALIQVVLNLRISRIEALFLCGKNLNLSRYDIGWHRQGCILIKSQIFVNLDTFETGQKAE